MSVIFGRWFLYFYKLTEVLNLLLIVAFKIFNANFHELWW